MNRIILIIVGITGMLSIQCCEILRGEDDELSLILNEYTEDGLNLNGYYYSEKEADPDNIFTRYFLYKNGVLREGGSVFTLNDTTWLSGESKLDWGVFEIVDDVIRFEKWYPNSGGALPAYVREGKILTDTSFHILRSYRVIDGEKTENRDKDEIYYLQRFSPKLDSLNDFVN